jgi:hypothetical protein
MGDVEWSSIYELDCKISTTLVSRDMGFNTHGWLNNVTAFNRREDC